MRIRNVIVLVVLSLFIGAAMAASDSSVPLEEKINDVVIAANSHILCIDSLTSCNDVKVAYWKNGYSGSNGYYTINGYEYGCGYTDRMVSGTLITAPNGKWYIGWNVVLGGLSNPNPILGGVTMQLTNKAGPYQYQYHDAGYWHGTGTAQVVTCPVNAPLSNEPDDAVQ